MIYTTTNSNDGERFYRNIHFLIYVNFDFHMIIIFFIVVFFTRSGSFYAKKLCLSNTKRSVTQVGAI